MSAFTAKIHELLAEAKAELEKLLGHGDAEVQAATKAATEKLDQVKAAVETDGAQLEHEAVSDAEHVAVTAETEGLKPAEAEAVADAAKLGADAVHDAETAVTEQPATAPASETPATPSA